MKKMFKKWCIPLLVLSLFLTACGTDTDDIAVTGGNSLTVQFDGHGEIAYQHVVDLQEYFPNRLPFTVQERKTAEWLVSQGSVK